MKAFHSLLSHTPPQSRSDRRLKPKSLKKQFPFNNNNFTKKSGKWDFIGGAIGILLFLSSVQCLLGEELRIWTDTTGRTTEAYFVSAREGVVVIRRKIDGRIFDLPYESLSAQDKTFLVTAPSWTPPAPEPPRDGQPNLFQPTNRYIQALKHFQTNARSNPYNPTSAQEEFASWTELEFGSLGIKRGDDPKDVLKKLYSFGVEKGKQR